MTKNSSNLTLTEAQTILRYFNCVKPDSQTAPPNYDLIKQALLLVADHADYHLFGICAETAAQGILALKKYATAFGYEALPLTPIPGQVYIKFNPHSQLCYIDSYMGEHRGVLISCQSSSPDRINEMYGHLPLDLFGNVD